MVEGKQRRKERFFLITPNAIDKKLLIVARSRYDYVSHRNRSDTLILIIMAKTEGRTTTASNRHSVALIIFKDSYRAYG